MFISETQSIKKNILFSVCLGVVAVISCVTMCSLYFNVNNVENQYVKPMYQSFNSHNGEIELDFDSMVDQDLLKYRYQAPLDIGYGITYDTLIDFCKQNNIYMEVNESSLVLPEGGLIERMLYWVKKARDNGNMISLGTDAHSCYEVGKFDNVAVLLNELNYPKDLILNCDDDKLQDLLKVE
jgi:hypothetical protein